MGTINLGVAALQSSRPRVHHRHHHRAVIQNTKYIVIHQPVSNSN